MSQFAIISRPDRAIVALRGPDAIKFLHNLTTNDVRLLVEPHAALYTALLDGKGRTLFESTLSLSADSTPELPTVLMEVAADQSALLATHLRRSRVRARVDIVDQSDALAVTSVVPSDPFALSARSPPACRLLADVVGHLRHATASASVLPRPPPQQRPPVAASGSASVVSVAPTVAAFAGPQQQQLSAVFVDPRNPRLGARVVAARALALGGGGGEEEGGGLGMPRAPLAHFSALRTLLGAPEGAEVTGLSPLEWSLPYLNGVSFAKGCYLGQENVARTHFRGAVRRRLVPVVFSPAGAPARPVACADPVSAAMVHQPDEAQRPGGHGRGRGHGPAQSHGFPAPAAPEHAPLHHASSRAGSGGHSRLHGADASAARAAATPHDAHALRLPFPFLDLGWRGAVEAGAPLASGGAAATAAASAAGADSGGGSGGSVGSGAERGVGRVLAPVPHANLGFALLRMDQIAHVFPPAAAAAAASASAAETAAVEPSAAAPGSSSSAADDDSDEGVGSDAAVVAAFQALHARAASRVVDLKVGPPAASSPPAEHGAYRVTPVLPMFWRRIPRAGVEEPGPGA